MKKSLKKKILTTAVCGALAAMCIPSMASNPGGADDPLITMSYVNDVIIPQIKSYVDTQVQSTPSQGNTGTDLPALATGTVFNVVNVSKGQTIIGGKSCQMILRMGNGKIVASSKGGVADVTAGVDLTTGTKAPANHLLIIPVDDWRGITMETDGIIMICGAYSVNN